MFGRPTYAPMPRVGVSARNLLYCSPVRTRRHLPMPDPMPIAVYSDVICPWCYVGKRRLEAALAGPGMPAASHFLWLPFELNPDMPPEGVTRQTYREAKFGAARSAELDGNML